MTINRISLYCFLFLRKIGLINLLSDEVFLKINFRLRIGRPLNLNNPRGFNDKLQWLKLYDRNPKYTTMVDKYYVKEYISNVIGKEYVIPTIGVWDTIEDIDFSILPNQFVMKTTHDSGGCYICKDKSKLDNMELKKIINRSLNRNYYIQSREWPYKNVKPRIIVEPYLVDESGFELKDYKLMCFNGKVRCSFVCSNRNSKSGLNVNFYDRDWIPMPFERHYPKNNTEIPKPICYELMIELAEKLSKDIPFVRVDFYQIDNKPKFGELTFYPGAGLEEFTPEEWDFKLGDLLVLPINKYSS